MANPCPLCEGKGVAPDIPSGMISDNWLTQLQAYCKQYPQATIPASDVGKIINYVWETTGLALQYAQQLVQSRQKQ